MTTPELLPWLAGGGFAAFAITVMFRRGHTAPQAWLFPTGLAALFLVFSLGAVITEGPTGFWTEHTRNMWGNQIWFDLLLAVGIGWYLALPQMRAVGMRPLPWLVLIGCTGCIGFLAAIARLLYLRERTT